MKRTKIFSIIFLVTISHLFSIAQPGDGVKPENVMAVYIYNFTKFLEWNDNDSESFYISVLGNSKIIEPLILIAQKEKINGKKIIIDKINNMNQLKNNSILFIPGEYDSYLQTIIKRAYEKNVLTISNSKGFASKGICINFFVADDKMKFEINKKAIENAGITPNTRLLSLAYKVYE